MNLNSSYLIGFVVMIIAAAVLIYFVSKKSSGNVVKAGNLDVNDNFVPPGTITTYTSDYEDDDDYDEAVNGDDDEGNNLKIIKPILLDGPKKFDVIGSKQHLTLLNNENFLLRFAFKPSLKLSFRVGKNDTLIYLDRESIEINNSKISTNIMESKRNERLVFYLYKVDSIFKVRYGFEHVKFEKLTEYLAGYKPDDSKESPIIMNIFGGDSKVKPKVNVTVKKFDK